MKLWIVGAKGLLGSTLSSLCDKSKMVHFDTSRDQADITHLDLLRRIAHQNKPTHIVNCAAYTDVDGAETNQERAFHINAEGAENLAQVAKEFDAKFIHISTNFVFDGMKETPYLETDACRPLGLYGQSKWEGEQKVLSALPSACIIRTSWLFGKRGNNFLSSLMHFLKNQKEMRVVEDQIASLTACEDLSRAVLDLLCHSGVFHFANRGECSRFQVAGKLLDQAKVRGIPLACQSIIPVSSREFTTAAKRPPYSPFNISKVEGVLGRTIPTWQEAMQEYLNAQ